MKITSALSHPGTSILRKLLVILKIKGSHTSRNRMRSCQWFHRAYIDALFVKCKKSSKIEYKNPDKWIGIGMIGEDIGFAFESWQFPFAFWFPFGTEIEFGCCVLLQHGLLWSWNLKKFQCTTAVMRHNLCQCISWNHFISGITTY